MSVGNRIRALRRSLECHNLALAKKLTLVNLRFLI